MTFWSPVGSRGIRSLALSEVLTLLAVTCTMSVHASSAHASAPRMVSSTATVAVTTVSAAATTTATATQTSLPTQTPTTTPTPKPAPPPKPYVHRTNGYQIGAYYFSGWSHGQNDNLTSLFTSGPLRWHEPLVGWYDDSQIQVDNNILQASGVGIDFFAFDWYDLAQAHYPSDNTLNEALGYYMASRQRSKMNFCLTFIDQAPFVPRARDWPRLVNTWIGYFKQPDYVRVNGKPLFIIFSPEHMREIFGSSRAVHRALDYLRGKVRNSHLPGVTIAVGATLTPRYNAARVDQLRSEGYDVTTGYNYHATGGEKYRTPVPYGRLVDENEQMWDRVAKTFRYPYIPVITSGWDQRFSLREQKTAIIYAGRTPGQFACYASAARRWIDRNARQTVRERIVLVFAWNEVGEGGAIMPNKVYRFAYTTALRHAFVSRLPQQCAS